MPSLLQRVEASTKEKLNKTNLYHPCRDSLVRASLFGFGPFSTLQHFRLCFSRVFFLCEIECERIDCLLATHWMDGWLIFFSLFLHGPYSYMFNLAEFTDDANICSCKQGKRLSCDFYMLCGKGRKHTRNKTHPRDYFRIFVLATKSSLLVLFQNCPL